MQSLQECHVEVCSSRAVAEWQKQLNGVVVLPERLGFLVFVVRKIADCTREDSIHVGDNCCIC